MYLYKKIKKHIAMQIPSGWGVGKSETGWMTSNYIKLSFPIEEESINNTIIEVEDGIH